MSQAQPSRKNLYRHWIGVECGWHSETEYPLDRLVSLPPENLTTHALLIGSTGSGKTTLLHHLIAQDVLMGHAFIILDLRGDLVAATMEILAGRVDPRNVRLIDLREKSRPTGFNPLAGSGEPYYRALGVLDAIEGESDSWGVQLAETLRNALMLLSEAGEPLTKLEDLFYDSRFLSRCIDQCPSERTTAFWIRFDDLSPEKKTALAMPVLNKASALTSTETLRQILGHPRPIDLTAHLNTPGSVLLVSLAVDELHGAGRMMGRMILSSICREIFARVNTPESKRNPVRLIVDEFENFGTSHFESILAEGRRFRFSTILAHQTLAQLSPKMRALILGNVGTKVVLRTGRDDAATLSRDLTGDPKALDFAGLPTGHAVLWNRTDGCIPVEINAPIVRDVGRRSAAAHRFWRQVQAQGGPVLLPPPSGERSPREPDRPQPPRNTDQRRNEPKSPRTDLEDWLCD